MARPLRIEYEGALYHVMSRGNERRAIVRDDADRAKRLQWYKRTVDVYGWRVHAFCLLTNHDHLFLETPRANLSAGMQYLNGGYSGYFNARHRRQGHLFQGRFKAHLIEEEGHYLEVSRYIHLNPVRAGAAARPQDYPWSSYRGYVNQCRALDWVTYNRVLREFGAGRLSSQRRAYRRFVDAGVAASPSAPWSDAHEGLVVGSESFVEKIATLVSSLHENRDVPDLERLRRRPALKTILVATADVFGEDPRQWKAGRRDDSGARAVAAFVARTRFGYGGRTVAAALGYTNGSSVSRSIRQVEGNRQWQKVASKIAKKLQRSN